jgi:hypothetical protein
MKQDLEKHSPVPCISTKEDKNSQFRNLIIQSNETGLGKHSTLKGEVPVPFKYHAMKEYRGVEVEFRTFLTSPLHTSVQPEAPPPQLPYPWQNSPAAPTEQEAQWPQTWSGCFGEEKTSCPDGNSTNPSASQPTA